MKNPLLALVACALFSAAPAFAQTKATTATIEELLKVAKFDQTMNAVTGQMDGIMTQAMQQALAGRNLPPEAMEKAKEMSAKMTAAFKEDFSAAKMKEITVGIYSDVFTEDEVRAIIDFYKTPGGQALINKQPQVMQKLMTVMQQKMTEIMPKIKAVVDESVAETEGAKPK
ncbi:MAG TPA: DUF2059 domain-containing protein [Chthoniobacteraceae bacterium]|jgi:hypothetical protein